MRITSINIVKFSFWGIGKGTYVISIDIYRYQYQFKMNFRPISVRMSPPLKTPGLSATGSDFSVYWLVLLTPVAPKLMCEEGCIKGSLHVESGAPLGKAVHPITKRVATPHTSNILQRKRDEYVNSWFGFEGMDDET